jgi:hypothetical protein
MVVIALLRSLGDRNRDKEGLQGRGREGAGRERKERESGHGTLVLF